MIEFYETSYDMASKLNADLEPILFGHEDCRPSHAYGPTIRGYHLFHFITRGCGIVEIGGCTFSLGAGDAFLIPAETAAYYEASRETPWSYYWMGITGLRASQYVQQILDLFPCFFRLSNIFPRAISRSETGATPDTSKPKPNKERLILADWNNFAKVYTGSFGDIPV